MTEKPFGPNDPNTAHQLWSRWIFGIQSKSRRPLVQDVVDNARRFLSIGLRSHIGRVRCDEQAGFYSIICEIEGPPAHDVGFVEAFRKAFVNNFIKKGFGAGASLEKFTVGILSGDRQDGLPPEQFVVIPCIRLL